MNQLPYDELHQNGKSACAELMVRAERELSPFFLAVAELFGLEQLSSLRTTGFNSWRS